MDDRDLLRHLRDGGDEVYDRPEPPALDLAAITAAAERRPERRTVRARPLVVAAGACACVGLGMLVGATWLGGSQAPAPTTVAATSPSTTPAVPQRTREVQLARFGNAAPSGAAAEASVFTATDGRTVELRVRGLRQPRKGEFYELWILGEGTRMVSLGIVRVDASGSADVRMPLPVSLRRFPVFDLSLEPGDGDPAHSGRSILRSAAVA